MKKVKIAVWIASAIVMLCSLCSCGPSDTPSVSTVKTGADHWEGSSTAATEKDISEPENQYVPGIVTPTFYSSEWLNLYFDIPLDFQCTQQELDETRRIDRNYEESCDKNSLYFSHTELPIYDNLEKASIAIYIYPNGPAIDDLEERTFNEVTGVLKEYGFEFSHEGPISYTVANQPYTLYKKHINADHVVKLSHAKSSISWSLYHVQDNKTVQITLYGFSTEPEIERIVSSFTPLKNATNTSKNDNGNENGSSNNVSSGDKHTSGNTDNHVNPNTSPCANGHKWIDATCSSPATCSVCGKTSGQPLGHDLYITKCTRCDYTDFSRLAKSYSDGAVAAYDSKTGEDYTVTNVKLSDSGIFSFHFNGKQYSLSVVQTNKKEGTSDLVVFDCYLDGKREPDATFYIAPDYLNPRLEWKHLDGCDLYIYVDV